MNGKCDIVFLGDSITDAWRHPRGENETGKQGGKEVFDKYYGAMHPLNLGIGGDRTQHVIWRLDNGEVDGISPKVVVLMIGTNNLGTNTNEQIITADTKIVQILHEKLPHTKVLLLGVFPRSVKADGQYRGNIKAINEGLSKLDDGGKTVKYLDIGEKFLDANGTLSPDIMPDALHPNARGYEIWAKAIQPALDELMK
jgi:lysophospholipase L1-like esterase